MDDPSSGIASRQATRVSKSIWQTCKGFVSLASLILAFLSIALVQLHLTVGLTEYLIGFAIGVVFTFVVKPALRGILRRSFTSGKVVQTDDSTIYSLKHGVLNIDVGATQMWMNMGYWKDQPAPRNLSHACESLLEEVLVAAGLSMRSNDHAEDAASPSSHTNQIVNIVDVGFGCGDQAMALPRLCDLGSYIGLTIDKKQFTFAKQRLRRSGFLSNASGTLTQEHGKDASSRHVFLADAAKPGTWADELKNAVAEFSHTSEAALHRKNWILALDVLYHLSPSRLPLFRHAYSNLHASIMAFDLLLPDPQQGHLTQVQTYLLRLVALMTSTPYSNFLTPAQYRDHLVSVGYSEGDIEIRDISEYVFGPLVEFMTWQDRQLKSFGLGIGAFHAARWVFGWWARTGIVRGCIIIARARKGGTRS